MDKSGLVGLGIQEIRFFLQSVSGKQCRNAERTGCGSSGPGMWFK